MLLHTSLTTTTGADTATELRERSRERTRCASFSTLLLPSLRSTELAVDSDGDDGPANREGEGMW
jgi:hypothetical protein